MCGATYNVAGATIYRAFDSCLDYFRHDSSIEIKQKKKRKEKEQKYDKCNCLIV